MLREAFDYPFRDIAEALDLSESNAGQLANRARKHLVEQSTTGRAGEPAYSRHGWNNADEKRSSEVPDERK